MSQLKPPPRHSDTNRLKVEAARKPGEGAPQATAPAKKLPAQQQPNKWNNLPGMQNRPLGPGEAPQ